MERRSAFAEAEAMTEAAAACHADFHTLPSIPAVGHCNVTKLAAGLCSDRLLRVFIAIVDVGRSTGLSRKPRAARGNGEVDVDDDDFDGETHSNCCWDWHVTNAANAAHKLQKLYGHFVALQRT